MPPLSLPAVSRRAVALAALLLSAACAGRPAAPARPAPRALPPEPSAEDAAALRARRLLVPVPGVRVDRMASSFDAPRGDRLHLALDLLAPRGTPVLSADDGRIWKLRSNNLGGITVYATDPEERFVYYYAHLDRYRDGLFEGMPLLRGDTLGFVGTTGNAPPDVPHLHFQVSRLGPDRRWWTGTPIDPLPYLRESVGGAAVAATAPARGRSAPATGRRVPRPTVPALEPDSVAATDSLLARPCRRSAADTLGAPRVNKDAPPCPRGQGGAGRERPRR